MANIIEKLMKVDAGAIDQREVRTFASHRLARILGEKKPVELEIEELPYRQVSEIMTSTVKNDGTLDFNRKVDAELRLVLAAVKNIDFKNKDLQKKFGCATPKDLAEKLLEGETPQIAQVVLTMAGYTDEEEEIEEVKN